MTENRLKEKIHVIQFAMKRKIYQKPNVDLIEVRCTDILAGSGIGINGGKVKDPGGDTPWGKSAKSNSLFDDTEETNGHSLFDDEEEEE